MKRHFYLILYFLCRTAMISAQVNSISDLQKKIENETSDTSRVLLLDELSFLYLNSNTDTAFIVAQQALLLSGRIHYEMGEATSLKRLATVFDITGNYPRALEFSLNALKKFEHIRDIKGIESVLLNIAIIFGEQEDYKQALKYCYRAKLLANELHDNLISTKVLINIGTIYELSNQLDSARFYIGQAYNAAVKLKSADFTGISLAENGNINRKMDQPNISLEYYKAAIPHLKEAGNDYSLCDVYLGMAKSFQQINETDSCLYYAKLCFFLSKQDKFISEVLAASQLLTDHYKTLHNTDSAFTYQSHIIIAKDNLFSQEKNRQLENLSFNETMRQVQIESTKAEVAEERKHNIQYAILAVSIIGFMIIYLLLTQSIIVNERWVRFLGILGLLLIFEFANLLIHPLVIDITHHSPILILIASVIIGSVLIPFHHKIEHWVTAKMVSKNKRLRLAAARKIIAKLENDVKE